MKSQTYPPYRGYTLQVFYTPIRGEGYDFENKVTSPSGEVSEWSLDSYRAWESFKALVDVIE
jgi:hypothetical protein